MKQPVDQIALKQMNLEQRLDWFHDHVRQYSRGWLLRVDGNLVALGETCEFDDMLAVFLMFIARPTKPVREFGMG